MNKLIPFIRRFLLGSFLLLLMFYGSSVAIVGSGILSEPLTYFSKAAGGGYKLFVVPLLTFFFFIASSCFNRFLFWCISFPLMLVMLIYFPIGVVFGVPNDGQVASALNTDPAETIEFIKSIFGINFVYPITALIAIVVSRYLSHKWKIQWWGCPWLYYILAYTIAVHLGDFQGVREGFKNLKNSYVGIQQLKKQSLIKSKWDILDVRAKHDINVLVIGESARRDYMHAYGYPIKNTPFMESKGVLIDGAVSPADYTIQSIQKMLTLTDKNNPEVNLALNVIDAANAAGYDTFWFSNQGKINSKDTPITQIANRSKTSHWIKEKLSRIENTSDRQLLPLVKDVVEEDKSKSPKFIVLHLMGSHSDVCERLTDQPLMGSVKNKYYQDPLCYVSSVKQTDVFLEKLDDILKDSGKSYSVIYLADHGVSHNIVSGRIVMNHAKPADSHRKIPLYSFGSDSLSFTKVRSVKYMSNLTAGLLQWLGVKTAQIPDLENWDLFSSQDQPDFKQESKEVEGRRLDPAIDIRGK